MGNILGRILFIFFFIYNADCRLEDRRFSYNDIFVCFWPRRGVIKRDIWLVKAILAELARFAPVPLLRHRVTSVALHEQAFCAGLMRLRSVCGQKNIFFNSLQTKHCKCIVYLHLCFNLRENKPCLQLL